MPVIHAADCEYALWYEGIADQIERVSTEEAMGMALRLVREEGVFAGTSTGTNVVAALRLTEQLGDSATVITLMCDTGMKYLKTYGSHLLIKECDGLVASQDLNLVV